MDAPFQLRKATFDDIPDLERLIARSARDVGSQDYDPRQTDAAIAHVYGVDSELIRDGTYFVVTAGDEIIGCGGWSRRRTLFGGDNASARPAEDGFLDPSVDAAKIRAFFVDPRFVRRGIGAALIDASEEGAVNAGFRGVELMATLTGEKLYVRFGYAVTDRTTITLPGNVVFPLARMVKRLTTQSEHHGTSRSGQRLLAPATGIRDSSVESPVMSDRSLQDAYAPHNRCFGCGPANEKGLRIKSFLKDGEVVAEWRPEKHHEAFEGVLSGGIAGTLLDCHSNWTAAHHLMEKAGASAPPCTVTADFHVVLKRPTPMDMPLQLRARVVESGEDRAVVEASIEAGGKVTATCRGTFVAVKEGHPAFHRW